jgi:hypothetical protein
MEQVPAPRRSIDIHQPATTATTRHQIHSHQCNSTSSNRVGGEPERPKPRKPLASTRPSLYSATGSTKLRPTQHRHLQIRSPPTPTTPLHLDLTPNRGRQRPVAAPAGPAPMTHSWRWARRRSSSLAWGRRCHWPLPGFTAYCRPVSPRPSIESPPNRTRGTKEEMAPPPPSSVASSGCSRGHLRWWSDGLEEAAARVRAPWTAREWVTRGQKVLVSCGLVP